ncbi:hypothetical protein [Campylobacter sp.]|uniref:hypothetical protein n=1 Tax=Campylobacter sp. TaxID=205 RepID=UPI0025BCD5F6|nr:hypothetical protein [Campylobacter sp.]
MRTIFVATILSDETAVSIIGALYSSAFKFDDFVGILKFQSIKKSSAKKTEWTTE